ncbi:MAG: hypothetical protein CMP61_00820 [Flavobacteriales bacterium]|nr:hypothetical protein [Flavobacteriales bacterium]
MKTHFFLKRVKFSFIFQGYKFNHYGLYKKVRRPFECFSNKGKKKPCECARLLSEKMKLFYNYFLRV